MNNLISGCEMRNMYQFGQARLYDAKCNYGAGYIATVGREVFVHNLLEDYYTFVNLSIDELVAMSIVKPRGG